MTPTAALIVVMAALPSIVLAHGHDVVIPADGLGTGLAELPKRAPKLHAMIEQLIADLENPDA